MVQMIGVIVFALGEPALFASLDKGEHLDNKVMVLGYVVMRIPLAAQWLRAAAEDRPRRRQHLAYVVSLVVSQLLWCYLAITPMTVRETVSS